MTTFTSDQARQYVAHRLSALLAEDYDLPPATWRTWCAAHSPCYQFTQQRSWVQATPTSKPVLMFDQRTLNALVKWLARNLITTKTGKIRISWKAGKPGKVNRRPKAIQK